MIRFLLLMLVSIQTLAQVSIGNSYKFKCVATYSDGSALPCPATTVWNSATPGVLSINSSGVGVAVTQGTSNVTASVGTVVSNTVAEQVVKLTALTMQSVVSVPVGQSVQLAVNCNYSNGVALSCYNLDAYGDMVSFYYLKAGPLNVANVGPTGLVTGVIPGSAAVWTETNSLYGESFIVVQ